MNKQCYRIIFSRTQGELIVVSELARSCSTQPGQSRSSGGARLWVTLRRAMWLIGLALFTEPVLAAGIVADGQLAPAQRPEVITTQNGLQQVNINAPNRAGISHNQYQQFDVGQQGAILNNSAVMTATKLAGYIQGNGKLDPNSAPARVIINEVNSNNPSQLRGFLEVAGGKAQVVVANPSGIVCDGCGTINAGRMTLTTGKPQLNADGSIAGYQVERGLIRVEGGGLNGDPRHDTEYVDILARAVQVNGGIWAKEGVAVVVGRNQVGADGKVTALAATGDNTPALAIDMGQMGGMYSGYIRMVGTEAGVGVRNQGGHLQADKKLTVTSEGKLTWLAGTVEPYTQAGGGITLAARDSIEHQGKLHSGGQLVVQSRQGSIRQSGTLAAAGNVTLRAAQGIHSSGHLLAGSDANSTLIRPADLTLESQADIRASGSLMSQNRVNVTGRTVDLNQSRVAAGQAVLTAQAGDIALQQAQVDSGQLTVNSAGDVYSQQAQIRAGRWHITADSLFNQAGVWSQVAAGESRFSLTGALDNTGGSIEAQQLSLNSATLNNLRGRLVALDGSAQRWQVRGLLANQSGVMGSNGSLQLDTGALDNQQGTLQSQSHLTLTTQQGLNNRQGKVLSGGTLALNSQHRLNNQNGEIRGQHLQLAGQAIDNQHGMIEATEVLDVSTRGSWDNRQGIVVGGSQASIVAASLDNAAGKLQSGGRLTLSTTGDVSNQAGTLTAQQDLAWQGGEFSLFNNDNGKLLTGGALSLQGGKLTNRQQGVVQSQQALAVNLTGAWDNQDGRLASGGSTTLHALSLINTQGEIQASDSLNMQLTRTLDNRHGNIISQRTQVLQAGDILNTRGRVSSLGTLTVNSQEFDNREGNVASQQDASLTATRWDNRNGTLQSAASLVLRTAQDLTNQGGRISAQTRLWLQGLTRTTFAGVLYNTGGQLLAGEQLWVQARGIDNQQHGLIWSQQQLQLTLNDSLDNRQGKLQSGAGMQINAAWLLNAQGVIDSQQQLDVQLVGPLDNSGGSIRTGQAQQIVADHLLNVQGVLSSQGSLGITARQLDNQDGMMISQATGDYHFSDLDNQQGKIHSGGALTLDGDRVDNQGGQLVSGQALTLNSRRVNNRGQGVISSQGTLNLTSQQLDNRDGGQLTGTTQTRLNTGSLDNRGGRVQSVGTLTLSLLETLDNRQGQIVANSHLSINASEAAARALFTPASLMLLNQQGAIRSGGALTVNARTLNNQGGTLLSQQALQLTVQQDYTHRQGDTLTSNSAMTLNVAGVFTNLADWLLPGDLSLHSTQLNNLASLVGKTLKLTTGAFLNQGRTEADTLAINSDSLDNQATLMADNLTVNSRIIDNHGREALIAATEHISLITGERLTNRDSALIYSAGSLQLSSNDLIENRASNIEAEGDVTLTAKRFDNLREGLEIARAAEKSDYQWHRYNYYWRSYGTDINTDPSTMAPATQQLTFRDDDAAASNPYGTLLNIDATAKRAQVRVKNNQGNLVNLWVNYQALTPNDDGSYNMTFYETRGWKQNTVPTPYHNTVWREHNRGRIEQWDPQQHLDIAGAPFVEDYNNLRERTITGTVTSDRLVSAGRAAYVLAGGNMSLNISGQLLNDASTISASGNLSIDTRAGIINRGYSVNERRQEVIVDHYDRSRKHWYPTFNRDETTALSTIDGVISGNGNVTITGAQLENTTVSQAQISAVEAAQNAAAAERAEWERNPLAVDITVGDWQAADTGLAGGERPLTPGELALTDQQHLSSVATNIPNNGLFRQQVSADSPFLVVTDPRFANKNNFLSSDYLLQRVGYNPSQVHKRLGDGYYEQRLVREQILQLTGRPSLGGEDAMAQYQSLMNNGITVAADFHLVPGVALTPAQIAALQQDIVWLVSETVDTAEGPQTVWVPKVYLANSTVRVSGDGAVIAGGNLQLSADSINNAGNLVADNALGIDSSQFLHQGGEVNADRIRVQADSIGLSTDLQNALRQATMNARELSLSGGDISLQGAKLRATENLSLSASNSLNITAAKSSHKANLNVISGAMGNRNSAGQEEAGQRMAQVSGEWQQALGSSLSAGGNLSLKAGQDITLQGSQAKAGGQLGVQAGGDITLLAERTTNRTHLQANSRTSSMNNNREEERLLLSSLSGDGGVSLVAGKDLLATGAQVDSEQGRVEVSAQHVTIKEARQQTHDQDSEQQRRGRTKSQRETETSRDEVVGSTFSGKDGVTVTAGDITVTGSTLHSEQGAVALQAKNDVTLNSATEQTSQYSEQRTQKKGLLKTTTTHRVQDDRVTREQGALLSGNSVSIQAGHDLAVSGSGIAADRDVTLQAGNHVDIRAATETASHTLREEKKKSGLLGSGGIGFTLGSQSSRHETDEKGTTQSQSVSTVGSSQGNVSITAGNQLHIGGADLVAGKDLSLTGDSVHIDPGYDRSQREERFESKQSGLSVALSGAAGGALNTAVSTAQQARQESDGRLAALQGTKAALNGVQAGQAVALEQAKGGDITKTVGVSVSLGSQTSSSVQRQEQAVSGGSALTAGNNLRVTATGNNGSPHSGDIAISGSQLQAGGDTVLDAQRDLHLSAAADIERSEGRNSSSGGSIGASMGTGGSSVFADTHSARGSEHGNGTRWNETTVDSGGRVTLSSGRDTTLSGAQVSGEQVTASAGRDLTLESLRDSDRYDSQQGSVSGGLSVPVGAGTGSASLSARRDKLHSNYDSVVEQSGIFAGKGGFDITTGNHTQLDGAVIASTADKSKNSLETGTLGFGDIHNQADFRTEHQGAGISTGGDIGGQFVGNMANTLLTGANNDGHAAGTTKSAVSDGRIVIRDQAGQQQDVSELSRDVEHANGSIGPIFDKEKEQRRLKEAQLIGEIGSQAADVARTQGDLEGLKAKKDPAALQAAKEQLAGQGNLNPTAEQIAQQAYNTAIAPYGTGSALQQGIQAATAAIQGLAGGNIGQAISGAASPYLAEQIHKLTDGNPEAQAMAHAVVGAVTAYASGNSALAGAAGAVSGELMAQLVMNQLYPGKSASELTETEKQTISALGTLAAGLTGGVAGDSMADVVAGAQAGKNAVENNFLSSKDVLNLHKELEEADKTGADKQDIYEKYAEVSKKNREEAVAEGCSGNPFCASGALSEAAAGSDIANSLKRLPAFSDLNSDDLAQLDRFVLAENEDSARTIYQAMPDYVKVALNGKEAVEAIGLGAAVGGKALAALGVVGKANNNISGVRDNRLPVPEAIVARNGLKIESNPKHTPGAVGSRPNAGIEPKNSLVLFENSIATKDPKIRLSIDTDGNIHRFFNTSKDGSGTYHWSGSSSDGKNALGNRELGSFNKEIKELKGKK